MRNASPHMQIFCLTPRTHTGTPRMHMGTSFWCVFDASAIFGLVTRWSRIFWMRVRTHQHQKTSLIEYCLECIIIYFTLLAPHLRSGISYRSPFAFGDIAQHTTFTQWCWLQKVDGKTVAGVFVTINKDKSTCKVAVKEGLLHRAYAFHALRVVPIASNNRTVMDLEDAYLHWKGLPKISFCFIRWSWRSRTGQVQLQGWLHH